MVVLALGFFVGPIQPLSTELSVEVTYPSNENHILAAQQLFGNLISAMVVPIFEAVRNDESDPYSGSLFFLFCIFVASMAYFVTFNGELRRSAIDHRI
jgi:hypothetical protein